MEDRYLTTFMQTMCMSQMYAQHKIIEKFSLSTMHFFHVNAGPKPSWYSTWRKRAFVLKGEIQRSPKYRNPETLLGIIHP